MREFLNELHTQLCIAVDRCEGLKAVAFRINDIEGYQYFAGKVDAYNCLEEIILECLDEFLDD